MLDWDVSATEVSYWSRVGLEDTSWVAASTKKMGASLLNDMAHHMTLRHQESLLTLSIGLCNENSVNEQNGQGLQIHSNESGVHSVVVMVPKNWIHLSASCSQTVGVACCLFVLIIAEVHCSFTSQGMERACGGGAPTSRMDAASLRRIMLSITDLGWVLN